MTITTSGVGSTSVNVASFASILGARYTPRCEWHEGRGRRQLANGQSRIIGLPWCLMVWDILPSAQRELLRAKHSGAAGTCYVWARTNEADAFKLYSATYIWPEDESRDSGFRPDFAVEYRNLVEVV